MSGGEGGEDGKFKESDGTGMGEGQGARDVSDQIEDEDQLLGAQPAGAEQQHDEPDQASASARLEELEELRQRSSHTTVFDPIQHYLLPRSRWR